MASGDGTYVSLVKTSTSSVRPVRLLVTMHMQDMTSLLCFSHGRQFCTGESKMALFSQFMAEIFFGHE